MVSPRDPRPPRIWEGLLRSLLPEGIVAEDILGNLREEYLSRLRTHPAAKAGQWYRFQALGIATRLLINKVIPGSVGLDIRPVKTLNVYGDGRRGMGMHSVATLAAGAAASLVPARRAHSRECASASCWLVSSSVRGAGGDTLTTVGDSQPTSSRGY